MENNIFYDMIQEYFGTKVGDESFWEEKREVNNYTDIYQKAYDKI